MMTPTLVRVAMPMLKKMAVIRIRAASALAFFCTTVAALGAEPVHLYRMKVEIYWNDYWGQLLSSSGDPKIAITGSGKTAGFDGIVTLNCQNGLYAWQTWEGALDGWRNEDGEPPLPPQVMTTAFVKFCR